jgi:hypothetical protein
MKRRMVGRVLNELKVMCKETFEVQFETLYRHLPGVAKENNVTPQKNDRCPGRKSHQEPLQYN